MNLQDLAEHDYEPVHGLPAPLPQGEQLLWQGSPCWRSLAIRAFHVRKVVIYFALFGLWRVGSGLAEGLSAADAFASTRGLGLAALLAVVLLVGMAGLYARTTVYTLTNQRIVMRTGVAVSMSMNIPFKVIESADFKRHADSSGDIPLLLVPSERTSYIMMWPNARPWHFSRPQPMLRCIPQGEAVAQKLADALQATHSSDTSEQPSAVHTLQAEAPQTESSSVRRAPSAEDATKNSTTSSNSPAAV